MKNVEFGIDLHETLKNGVKFSGKSYNKFIEKYANDFSKNNANNEDGKNNYEIGANTNFIVYDFKFNKINITFDSPITILNNSISAITPYEVIGYLRIIKKINQMKIQHVIIGANDWSNMLANMLIELTSATIEYRIDYVDQFSSADLKLSEFDNDNLICKNFNRFKNFNYDEEEVSVESIDFDNVDYKSFRNKYRNSNKNPTKICKVSLQRLDKSELYNTKTPFCIKEINTHLRHYKFSNIPLLSINFEIGNENLIKEYREFLKSVILSHNYFDDFENSREFELFSNYALCYFRLKNQKHELDDVYELHSSLISELLEDPSLNTYDLTTVVVKDKITKFELEYNYPKNLTEVVDLMHYFVTDLFRLQSGELENHVVQVSKTRINKMFEAMPANIRIAFAIIRYYNAITSSDDSKLFSYLNSFNSNGQLLGIFTVLNKIRHISKKEVCEDIDTHIEIALRINTIISQHIQDCGRFNRYLFHDMCVYNPSRYNTFEQQIIGYSETLASDNNLMASITLSKGRKLALKQDLELIIDAILQMPTDDEICNREWDNIAKYGYHQFGEIKAFIDSHYLLKKYYDEYSDKGVDETEEFLKGFSKYMSTLSPEYASIIPTDQHLQTYSLIYDSSAPSILSEYSLTEDADDADDDADDDDDDDEIPF